jgi:hypothetical protein
MIYTVVWSETANDALIELYRLAGKKQDITDASNWFDRIGSIGFSEMILLDSQSDLAIIGRCLVNRWKFFSRSTTATESYEYS